MLLARSEAFLLAHSYVGATDIEVSSQKLNGCQLTPTLSPTCVRIPPPHILIGGMFDE